MTVIRNATPSKFSKTFSYALIILLLRETPAKARKPAWRTDRGETIIEQNLNFPEERRDAGYKKGRLFRQPLFIIYKTYALLCYFLQQGFQFKIAFAGRACGKGDGL